MSKYTLDFTEEGKGERGNRIVSKKWYQKRVPLWAMLLIAAKAVFFLFGYWQKHGENKTLHQLHQQAVVRYDSLSVEHQAIKQPKESN